MTRKSTNHVIWGLMLLAGSFAFAKGPVLASGSGENAVHSRPGEASMVFVGKEYWPEQILPRAPRPAAAFAAAAAPADPQTGGALAYEPVMAQSAGGADHNHFYQRMNDAADRYRAQFADLPQTRQISGRSFKQGAAGPRTEALRARLGLSPGRVFDAELAEAVRNYRKAHGLGNSAIVDNRMIRSLNRGAAYYLQKIAVNLERAAEIPAFPGERYVLVDAAKQQLYLYEGEQAVDTMKVVVGKPSDPTPMMAALISYSTVNPYWNIPPDLTRDRYAPRAVRGGRSYLDTRGFEALSDWTATARVLDYDEVDWQAVIKGETLLRMRQRPGPGNGMGEIKFMFPNSMGIYLHDSPSRHLFAEKHRAFSAGCVRLERAWDVAKWIYGTAPQSNLAQPNRQVVIDRPVPVYITYFTAVPTASGFEFRDDFYNRDARAAAAIAARKTKSAASL